MDAIYSIEQLPEIAAKVWMNLQGCRVFAFHGQMGAGKTTFIHALCKVIGVKDVVSSPTFSLINEYFIDSSDKTDKIFHIDCYRLSGQQEAVQAGIEDCFYSDHICFIEWPEKVISILPPKTRHLFIDVIDGEKRKLRISDI